MSRESASSWQSTASTTALPYTQRDVVSKLNQMTTGCLEAESIETPFNKNTIFSGDQQAASVSWYFDTGKLCYNEPFESTKTVCDSERS